MKEKRKTDVKRNRVKAPYVFYRIWIGEQVYNSTDCQNELFSLISRARKVDKKAFVEAYGISMIHDEVFGKMRSLYHVSGPILPVA